MINDNKKNLKKNRDIYDLGIQETSNDALKTKL